MTIVRGAVRARAATPSPSATRWRISRTGNLYSRLALGVPLHDITGGYRVFDPVGLTGLTAGGWIRPAPHPVPVRGDVALEWAWRADVQPVAVRHRPIEEVPP